LPSLLWNTFTNIIKNLNLWGNNRYDERLPIFPKMTGDFIERLKIRLNQPLPGARVQDQMRARHTSGEDISFIHKGPPRQGGVALLLYQHQGSWFFPLMKRRQYPGIHSGQISLPGGKKEPGDRSLSETALRESREELGLELNSGQIVGSLSELYIIASHFNILPVVALMDDRPSIKPDKREVEYTITASIDQLLQHKVHRKELLVRGYSISAPYFDIENQVVWGATAMIINEFLTLVKELGCE
jgi:8-oxo-dGTP pyrophosphatase MutT (NUDIX family)